MKKKMIRMFLFTTLLMLLPFIHVNAKTEDVTDADTLTAALADTSVDTIVLNENITVTKQINIERTLILDLNGKTLTSTISEKEKSSIYVTGSLTVKDSIGNGKIVGKVAMTVNGGTLTWQSGDLDITDDYGIAAVYNGKIIVNNGNLTSLYSPLTGNNTTGAMNFKVNGGVLTAKQGPAIYMPGPIRLDITGGIMNGGISLRMGKVNISGGTINSITANIDDPKSYYDYSGNAWLPDALYVFGGTYTTDVAGQTNALDLNITGGTFNCENTQGSAVAIYDLGKVSQNSEVTISGTSTLKTKSTTRKAYQVLSLEAIGVTNPKTGYNNDQNIGKVDTLITGGTFSSDESEYLSDAYKMKQDQDGNFYVATDEKQDIEKTDTTIKENPNTYDNIITYIIFTVVGILTLSFCVKKVRHR